ncbi:DUF6907 domain-containing protein [Streptomyces sp. NPDC096310]|uniref:DUF6907 domain-containing protein n=1 Tax=Streptomyces sp. NPDC096310 TaxID=3366082 RepID=UPI00381BD91E
MSTLLPEPTPVPTPATIPSQPSAPLSPAAPPCSPAAPLPRTWLRRIASGGQIVESCPPVCTDRHEADLVGALDDLQHGMHFDGVNVEVYDSYYGTADWPLLSGRINIDPYSEDARRRVPHVDLHVFVDQIAETLDLDGLAAVIASVRAQCDVLDGVHAQLAQAVGEHGRTA